jgi:Tfp pilus assembly protein PilO
MGMARPDTARFRETRVIVGGAAVVVAALLITYGLLPFVRQWQVREARIESARARVAFLQDLTQRTTALQSAATALETTLSAENRRVLHARSATLAASALQTFLQDAADASHLVVMRLDVTPDDSAGIGGATQGLLARLPVSMSAYGDVSGVANMLEILASGPRVLLLDRVSLTRNTALAGAPDVVQMTVTLRAPVLPQ